MHTYMYMQVYTHVHTHMPACMHRYTLTGNVIRYVDIQQHSQSHHHSLITHVPEEPTLQFNTV